MLIMHDTHEIGALGGWRVQVSAYAKLCTVQSSLLTCAKLVSGFVAQFTSVIWRTPFIENPPEP